MPKSLMERIRSSSAISPMLNSPRTVLNKPSDAAALILPYYGSGRSDKGEIAVQEIIEIDGVFGNFGSARVAALGEIFG